MNLEQAQAIVDEACDTMDRARALVTGQRTVIDRQRDLIARLVAIIDEVRDNTEGHWPQLESGCIECTQGVTTDQYNTGPCAYHAALRFLAGKKDLDKRISPTLRLQCLLQAEFIDGKLEEFPGMAPGVRVVLTNSSKLLHEVAK